MDNLGVSIFVLMFSYSLCQGYYSVIGPRVIRPNSEYHCAISVQGTIEPTFLTAVIQGQSSNGVPFSEFCKDVIAPHSSVICKFEIGDLEDGNYRLQVTGTRGLDFSGAFPLKLIPKSYTVLIQTDRSVYQPGSKILFRALILNPSLKPDTDIKSERLKVYISDDKGNRVKEWNGIEAKNGVFTGELKLSENPVLGNWNISVVVHGQTYHKSIEVAEYILPKFIVDLTAPKHVTFKENIITINIDARYNYGKSIAGETTISVYPTIYSGVIQPIYQNPVRKVIMINGSTTVDFDIENDLHLNDEYERVVIVDVRVEESRTGQRQNNSVEVHFHKYDQKIELVKTADYFKPGFKYVAYAKVSNHDGTPVNPGEEITVRHGYSRVDEVYEVTKHRLNKDGVVKIEFFAPKDVANTTALRIEVEYRDLKERISPIPAAVSYSKTYLQVTLDTERPVLNVDVEISVNCTEPLKNINYVLMSKGDILLTNSLRVSNKKVFNFHFTAFHAMAPLSTLIVYYIRTDGEFISDAIDIEVDGLFENFINIEPSVAQSGPNVDVDFKIIAQPNSFIGLMAVDEHVKQLRGSYDITRETVMEDLGDYDPVSVGNPYYYVSQNIKSRFTWKPGTSNAYSSVHDSGADLLTNALVSTHKPTLEDIYLRPVFYGPSTVKPDRGFGLPLHAVTRPPLAGPYAFSRIPKPVWNKPKVFLLNEIENTWLFMNFSSGYEGKTSLKRRLPDSLTTWTVSGFSLSPVHGLSVMKTPKTVRVSKLFVVSIDLPYSVQRGEILAVPVVVHNNLNEDVIADVTLHNTEQKFEFAEVSNEVAATKKIELYRRKKLSVKKNSIASVSFMVMPLRKGLTEIRVTANTPKSQDVAVKNLVVELEGETEYYTKSLLIDLRQARSFKDNLNFTIPKTAVQDSQKIEASVFGDFLGPVIIHLENLIRLPTGCGEQNLVHFMPSLIILHYLRSTKQLTPAIENDAIDFLETSYQEQLNYKRKDGSFSPFGERDTNASVWLTSYVALALTQAKQFIYVDETIIGNALEWLSNVQGRDGSFVETGSVLHLDLQNTNGNSLALTAFASMAFLENARSYPIYVNKANRALDYIASNVGDEESAYTLALCSYVLQIAKHPSKQNALNLLETKAKTKQNMKWWAKDFPKNEEKNPWNYRPNSISIETTSYALLTYADANLLSDTVPVLNWLINQQNSLGGFTSSHDTVVGLQALYRLVTKFATATSMQVNIAHRKDMSNGLRINKNNAMILQTIPIDKDTREINVTAEGSGVGIFRVSYQYNMNVTGPWPLFILDPQVDKNSNRDHLQLSICVAFVSQNLSSSASSNMAVMEVTFPSGFTADRDSLPSLEVSQNVQKVEVAQKGKKVIMYFNNITTAEYCPTVSAFRTHKVALQKPVPVVVYDYYDTSRRARVFYSGVTATLCDICEQEDCGDICSERFDRQKSDESNTEGSTDGGSVNIGSNVFLLVISLCAIFFKCNP